MVSGCRELIEGNGVIESQALDHDPFVELSVDDEIAATVDLIPEADMTSVVLTTDQNLHEYVSATTQDERLTLDVIGRKRLGATEGVFVDIEAPQLNAVSANNGARVEVLGAADIFEVEVNNGAHFEGAEFEVGTLELDANNGASAVASCKDAHISVNNGGDVTLCATGQVTGRVANGGDLVVNCGGDSSAVQRD